MKKRFGKSRYYLAAAAGILLLVCAAFFCYRTVEQTIIGNEKEGLKSLADVNAQSLTTSLQAKSNLIYAALSGDMADEEAIRQSMLKVGERAEYIPLGEETSLDEKERAVCEEAGRRPGEVVAGPVVESAEGYYILYMTKAVYMNRSIAGYVQIRLNLDEIYAQEQALSNLEIGKDGYCLVLDEQGHIVMPSQAKSQRESMAISGREESGCVIEWVYEVSPGAPSRTRKLIAYDKAQFGEVRFVLCIVEDYDEVVKPIERISLYLCLIGIILMLWLGFFLYRLFRQQKEEEQLLMELRHEKELNEANEALKNQEKLMEKYNHSKSIGILTGAIAHEFNNLMTPIVLYTNLLEENAVILSEMPDEVEELRSAAVRCEELAKQLLDYSRQGRAEKVLTVYNATFAVQTSVRMIRKLLPDGVELNASVCKTSYYIRGQIGALNQIILNLSTNAIHAMPEGGKLTVQFGLSTEDDKTLRLIVGDTGCGIPEGVRAHIFDPFFTTKSEKEGTGIGLTVVRRLVEEHGGFIRVKTEEGRGSTFLIELPRCNQSRDPTDEASRPR